MDIKNKGRYLVNTNTKRIHDILNSTPRCKLDKMQQVNAVFFDSLEEAKNYPNEITPQTVPCKFCIKER